MGAVADNRNSARQRLWLVTELYYPEETSTGFYLTRIGEGLADEFDVKVLCGQPNYFRRGVTAPRREIHKGVEIFRASGTRLNKNVIAFRVINMITLGLSVFFHALRRFRPGDKVLVVTNPPSMPFIVAAASLVRGSAYTLLIHDNYPELMIAAKKTRPDSLLSRTLNHLNRWLYKYASKIIVVGRDMKQLLEQKTRGLDIPIVTIPNWAELETVKPEPRESNTLLQELGLLSKFVLLYAGNMGYPNDVETIIGSARELVASEEIHFIFLGTGAKRGYLEKETERHKLKNVTILDPMPRSEQINFLNACDVALVSLVEGMLGVSMPSRTYNALAAGKPLLALTDEGSELEQVIAEDQVGWSVRPGDAAGLAALITSIAADRSELADMAIRARNAALERYSAELAIGKYASALRSTELESS